MYKIIQNIEPKEIVSGFKARFVHGKSMTTAFWDAEAGSVLPLHSHIHEQVSIITEGEFEMTIGGKTKVYTPGGIIIIPSHVEHSGKAITNCKITDIFCPVREDYL